MDDSVREHEKEVEDISSNRLNFIQLSSDGSFPKGNNQVYIIKKHDKLRILLDTRKFFNYSAYLLTNIPKTVKRLSTSGKLREMISKTQYPNPIELKRNFPLTLTRVELDKHFTLLNGFFNDEFSWQCDINATYTGPLFLQIIFVKNNEPIDTTVTIQDFGLPEWVIVEPKLQINKKPHIYSQLIIQTILSRSLGPYNRWKEFFKTQSQLGYNAFHFAPIQELGASSSLYSIKDQLKLSSELFPDQNDESDSKKLQDIIKTIETSYNALSFVDILLNHTSYDSPWLLDSSDSYYNIDNTPELGSAIAVDLAIVYFSDDIANKKIARYPKGNLIENEDDLNLLLQILWEDVFMKLNIPNYFKFDTVQIKKSLLEILKTKVPTITLDENEFNESSISFDMFLKLIDEAKYNVGSTEFGVKLNFDKVLSYFCEKKCSFPLTLFISCIETINKRDEGVALGYLSEALNNIKGTIRYHILELKNNMITIENKIVSNYFTILKNGKAAANNGWIMNANPYEDFANSHNFHYLRRTIIIWGDLVKLRFGNSKENSPYLWKHMKKYVRKMAEIFHGFRLDNAHSTPLHVGEYFMRKARTVNTDLLIVSELFTGSSELDAIFTKKIGINGLVREAQRCWNTSSLSDTLNNYGHISKKTVGSLEKFYEIDLKTGQKWYTLVPTYPEGILYDVTHDNPSYNEVHGIMDTLSKAALLGFSNCFLGTTKGFDEFYENKISVVNEKRLYKIHNENQIYESKDKTTYIRFLFTPKVNSNNVYIKGNWDSWANPIQMILKNPATNLYEAIVPFPPGNYEYKFMVNGEWVIDPFKPLTFDWSKNHFFSVSNKPTKVHQNITVIRSIISGFQKKIPLKYPEIFLETHNYDIVTILREHTSRLKHCIVIVRNALSKGTSVDVDICINLPGAFDKCKHIFWVSEKILEKPKSQKFLLGMIGEAYEEFELRKFCDVFYNPQTEGSILHFSYMPPSFVCIIKTRVSDTKRTALCTLNNMLWTLPPSKKLCNNLNVVDLNYLMYSSEGEEQELNRNGTFYINGKGKLPYAGFASIYNDIKHASKYNDLSLPLFNNIREGFWLLDYYLNRLKKRQNFLKIYNLLEQYFGLLKLIPRHDIPTYFTKIILYIIRGFHHKLIDNVKISSPMLLAPAFFRNLLAASYQFISNVPSATNENYSFSLAAGLPHFSTGWSRVWGRDSFIAFRGEFLIPGLYKEGKELILMFAASLRHGLMPNLFDKLNKPRYNCRDACWWFIKAVIDYLDFTNREDNILLEPIELKFVSDNQFDHIWQKEKGEKKILKIADIIQNIFESHARGIKFREWDAGNDIDWEMQDEGFNIELCMDEETGFIMGGNQKNCLTWMDKMGSSATSGNKGWPATPRDGAPIEMTGLLKHCLDGIIKYNALKLYPYNSINRKNGKTLLFTDWSEKIKKNFERCYYVPIENEKDQFYDVNQYAVRRRGIYKDIYKCQREISDYQLRGNACIAIALAPELFTRKNALIYLGWVEQMLIENNSLGLKTLEKEDNEYIPFYNNSDDGYDRRVAKGYSYHQGPEWVWIYGYFLKALLILNSENDHFNYEIIMSFLSIHKEFIQNNSWLSLPEMTNANGADCEFTCYAQCWSTSCILDACYDIIKLRK